MTRGLVNDTEDMDGRSHSKVVYPIISSKNLLPCNPLPVKVLVFVIANNLLLVRRAKNPGFQELHTIIERYMGES